MRTKPTKRPPVPSPQLQQAIDNAVQSFIGYVSARLEADGSAKGMQPFMRRCFDEWRGSRVTSKG